MRVQFLRFQAKPRKNGKKALAEPTNPEILALQAKIKTPLPVLAKFNDWALTKEQRQIKALYLHLIQQSKAR